MASHPCSCILLAGGENRRAFLKVKGQRVLDRLLSVMAPMFDDIILVTNDPLLYLEWDVTIVTDHFDRRSSLTGIHAGLFAAGNPHALVAACHMPFVQPALVQLLLGAIAPHLDAIVPNTQQGYQPMPAVYSKRCLKPMASAIVNQKDTISDVLKRVRLSEIGGSELGCSDAALISFLKINSQEDLAAAEVILRRQNAK